MRNHVNHTKRGVHAKAAGAPWLPALAIASGVALPIAVADVEAATPIVDERLIKERAPSDSGGFVLAQFQLPVQTAEKGSSQAGARDTQPVIGDMQPLPGERRPRLLRGDLQYQYALGSESDITYRKKPDTDRRVHDNALIITPQFKGYIT